MLRSRRAAAVVACIVLAIVTAGCGAVDKQAYIKENNKIQTRAASALGKLNTSDPKSIDAARKEIDTAVADFKKLDVPEDYAKEHGEMVDSLEELSDVMGDIKTATEKSDVAAVPKLMERMNASQKKFNDAIDSMNKDLT